MDPATSWKSHLYQVSDELMLIKTDEIYPGKLSNGGNRRMCSDNDLVHHHVFFRLVLQVYKVGEKSLRKTDSPKELSRAD